MTEFEKKIINIFRDYPELSRRKIESKLEIPFGTLSKINDKRGLPLKYVDVLKKHFAELAKAIEDSILK